jgi:hypothetical protein
MDVQITPEPGPEEREAIEAALRRLIGRGSVPAAYRSAWRKAGLQEAVEPEPEPQAGARPRRSFGATRA